MRTPIAARVSAALDGVRTDPSGRWLLEGEGHAELALSGLFEGQVETVVLDRVRISQQLGALFAAYVASPLGLAVGVLLVAIAGAAPTATTNRQRAHSHDADQT